MILGAYVRGFRDWDVDLAYRAIRDSALVGPIGKDSREARAQFRDLGYIPATEHGMASASCTLDLAYDYWCAGAMADLLGKRDDAAMFYKLGQNYRNVFDPKQGFMRGRSKTGEWPEPFRPDRETDDYVETDAWQASFSVPHDIQGLISLMGGDEKFIAKLDELFKAPSICLDARPDISGMVGQDAQGNEPSNHIPYLYAFAGAPWKTQFWVRQVAKLYRNTLPVFQGMMIADSCPAGSRSPRSASTLSMRRPGCTSLEVRWCSTPRSSTRRSEHDSISLRSRTRPRMFSSKASHSTDYVSSALGSHTRNSPRGVNFASGWSPYPTKLGAPSPAPDPRQDWPADRRPIDQGFRFFISAQPER